MKTLQISLLIPLLLILFACNTTTSEVSIPADVIIDLAVDPAPPSVGESTLMITLTDTEGHLIENASITVYGNMDHEGMQPVERETSTGHNGVYPIPFEWSMGGNWILDVTVKLSDNAGTATKEFEVDVGAVSQNSIIHHKSTETVPDETTEHNDSN